MPRLESGQVPRFPDVIEQLGGDADTQAFLGDLAELEGFSECWRGKSWAAVEVDQQGALVELSVDMPGVSLKGAPCIPPSVGRCRKLRRLTLRAMGLGGLCEELGCCVELTNLSVPANPLRGDVPESLNKLTALQNFCIDDCHMTGKFLPMELFKRLAGTPGTYLYVANNSFASIDFRDHGLNQYTCGELLPWHEDMVAVSSFPGTEFLQWMLMLMRAGGDQDGDGSSRKTASELCVFLSAYATAEVMDEAIDDWHAGGSRGSLECELHGRYFEVAGPCCQGATVAGHRKFGCQWFHQWALNQVKAAMAGYKRFLVFTMCTDGPTAAIDVGKVGTCQKAEYAFLKSMQTAYDDLEVGVINVSNLEYFMREPLRFWRQNAKTDTPPKGCQDIHDSPAPFPREEYERLAV